MSDANLNTDHAHLLRVKYSFHASIFSLQTITALSSRYIRLTLVIGENQIASHRVISYNLYGLLEIVSQVISNPTPQ